MNTANWSVLARGLVGELVDEGVLRSEVWREAVEAVPRHVFVPRFYTQQPDGEWAVTGAGYNAGLLSHRLGGDRVFSIDIGAELVAAARGRLAGLGFTPVLSTAHGVGGLPEHAPFDRSSPPARCRRCRGPGPSRCAGAGSCWSTSSGAGTRATSSC